ncbi:efflux RND transporter periplasmic adaptor subunit [Stieleria varia]|uniref:Multidrug resistance protein MdtN n=1 Tax=Stieleria varia TaxID=2528005 RepID=A0A5C6B2E8_9BACT|nr:efflux RND transporter periplasmic adaptor subunit [Stieleria varia]TWU06485.1 multidrug resistance protein MdtN [Stieleria varia]
MSDTFFNVGCPTRFLFTDYEPTMNMSQRVRQIDLKASFIRLARTAATSVALTWSMTSMCYGQGYTTEHQGLTEPKYDILVAATEIGRIDEVNVDVGDVVQEGQVIARLEDDSQVADVKYAKERAAMHGESDAAKAEANFARNRLKQLQELAKQQMARPDEIIRATADLDIARSRELASIEQDALRQLELQRYELRLSRRKVLAPSGGVVAEVFHHPGEYLTPGDPAVIRLLVVDQIFGVFNLPAADALALHVGDPATVFVASLSQPVRATVHSIAPAINGDSGTIKVRYLLNNKDGKVRVGDQCRISIESTRPALSSSDYRYSRQSQRTELSAAKASAGSIR